MSAAAEALQEIIQAEGTEATLDNEHRAMARVVADELREVGENDPYAESWAKFGEWVMTVAEIADRRQVEQLIEEGYRTVLMARSAPIGEQVVVRSQADWEALPDRDFEDGFRRYGLIE